MSPPPPPSCSSLPSCRQGNNEEFLSRCSKLAERRKWTHLLQAFKAGLAKVEAAAGGIGGIAAPAGPAAAAAAADGGPSGSPAAAAAARAAAEVTAEEAAEPASGSWERGGRKKGGRTGGKLQQQEEKEAAASEAMDHDRKEAAEEAAGAAEAEAAKGEAEAAAKAAAEENPSKRRKIQLSEQLRHEWRQFSSDLAAAERSAAAAQGGFAFAFVEGKLVQALRHGWWLLLDEVNLAPSEVLERIAGILEAGGTGSVRVVEWGDTTVVGGFFYA